MIMMNRSFAIASKITINLVARGNAIRVSLQDRFVQVTLGDYYMIHIVT